MAFYKDIQAYLLTLKILGLLCISYDNKQDRVYISCLDERYARLVLGCIQVSMFSFLACYLANPGYFSLGVYNSTGNTYLSVEYCFCCVLVSFLSIYCYIKRYEQLDTVQHLLQLNKDKNFRKKCIQNLKRLYILYIILLILCCQNYLKGFYFASTPISSVICYVFVYTSNFMFCGMIMVWYSCMKRILKHHFACCNEKLNNLVGKLHDKEGRSQFRRLLVTRYDLLSICRDQLNSSYGLIMLAISAYMVLSSPSGIFFMISVIFEKSLDNTMNRLHWIFVSSFWNAPWLIVFFNMLAANGIDEEKFLLRILVTSSMSSYQDLRLYLLTLKYFGLLCFSYESKSKQLKVKRQDILYARLIFLLLLTVFIIIFIYCSLCPEDFFLKIYNKTGNIYLCFETCCCCMLLTFLICFCHIKRKQQLDTVHKLFELNGNNSLNKDCLRNLKRLYGCYIFFALLCCQNYFKAFYHSDIPFSAVLSYSVILTLNFSIYGILMIWFICLETMLKHQFLFLNQRLEQVLNKCEENDFKRNVYKLLKRRYRLLTLCRNNINLSYGAIMLVISSYIVFSSPAGIFFLVSVVMEKDMTGFMNNYIGSLTALLWNTPMLTIFIWTLSANKINEEANKTAKILSKIPRTGTGIEKMVQKFLLKNLRQKPILTAYGFFSLDKSTLFKLFTAIFTYMVILVQFKEMESSRKLLGQNN